MYGIAVGENTQAKVGWPALATDQLPRVWRSITCSLTETQLYGARLQCEKGSMMQLKTLDLDSFLLFIPHGLLMKPQYSVQRHARGGQSWVT